MLKIYSIFLRSALLCATLMFGTVINAQAGYLYALQDETSGNAVYGFSVNEATGALTALAGFPVATGGTGTANSVSERLTIDRANKRLYAINDGSNTVSAFSINQATGALTALPFNPIALGIGEWYTIAVHPSGSPLVVGNNFQIIRSYAITAATANEAAGSPYSVNLTCPFSSTFSRNGNFFYAGSNCGTRFDGFSVNAASGQLTVLAGSPFDSGGSQPLSPATDSSGRIFIANISGELRAFTTASGVPTAATGNPFASGLTFPIDGALNPNEQFYAVADRSGNQVGSYQIAGTGAATTLTAVGSPVGSGGGLTDALVFNSAGTFLFAANGTSRNITTYNFNPTTGALAFNNVQAASTVGAAGIVTGMDYLPSGTTAASVTVSGRVMARKRGVAKAIVLLTGADGVTRYANTSPFGYYRFEDVAVGTTYIFNVRSKQYTFAIQVLNITEEMNNLNFYGN